MMRGLCSAEQKAACPIQKCKGSDVHHLAFPASDYKTRIEKQWRELTFNKEQIPRCLHDAIHASGYIPEKLFRQEMASEIWAEEVPLRAQEERMHQLAIGQAVMQGEPGYFEDKQ